MNTHTLREALQRLRSVSSGDQHWGYQGCMADLRLVVESALSVAPADERDALISEDRPQAGDRREAPGASERLLNEANLTINKDDPMAADIRAVVLDAKRYQWLREHGQPFIELSGIKDEAGEYGTRIAQVPWALDAAIDRAIESESPSGEPK